MYGHLQEIATIRPEQRCVCGDHCCTGRACEAGDEVAALGVRGGVLALHGHCIYILVSLVYISTGRVLLCRQPSLQEPLIALILVLITVLGMVVRHIRTIWGSSVGMM